MKIALCFSGQLRSWREGYEFYNSNLFIHHKREEIDVFIHTWDEDYPAPWYMDAANFYGARNVAADKPFITQQFSHYKVIDERWPAVNTFGMWYSVFKANELKRQHELRNGFRYDVVIRTRFDFALNRQLDMNIQPDKLYVPNDLIKGSIPPNQLAANDQFAYGSSEVMDQYSLTFWNIDRAYKMGVPVNGEDMLSANLQLTGLAGNLVYIDMMHPFPPGKYNSTTHSLIRDDFKNWNTLRG